MTTQYAPQKLSDLTSAILNYRGTGVSSTASAGTSTNIDYKMTEDRLILGVEAILNGHVYGDNMHLQVVDVDGIMYPAGTVLNQFATSWFVIADQQYQPGSNVPYPAKIFSGLYVRVVYNSTGILPVNICINYHMHKVLA